MAAITQRHGHKARQTTLPKLRIYKCNSILPNPQIVGGDWDQFIVSGQLSRWGSTQTIRSTTSLGFPRRGEVQPGDLVLLAEVGLVAATHTAVAVVVSMAIPIRLLSFLLGNTMLVTRSNKLGWGNRECPFLPRRSWASEHNMPIDELMLQYFDMVPGWLPRLREARVIDGVRKC